MIIYIYIVYIYIVYIYCIYILYIYISYIYIIYICTMGFNINIYKPTNITGGAPVLTSKLP